LRGILTVHYEAGCDFSAAYSGRPKTGTHKINKQTSISHEENFLEINTERAGGQDIKRQNAIVESESERNRLTLAEP